MKTIGIIRTSLRPVALSLALLGAGIAFTTAAPAAAANARAESIGHGHGNHAHRGGRAPFASLGLTEAQRDKLFEVRHAQAPAMRAQMKELRAARTELRTLAMSDRYDETRAAALTERAAKAQATLALLNARSMNEFYKVLTPEQRQKLEAQRAQRAQRGEVRGHRG